MGIEDDIALLGGVPLLAVLGDEALKILAFGAEMRHVGLGTALFQEGETAEAAFVVQQGSFQLTSAARRSETVSAGRGTLLAEAALLTRTKHHVTATAEAPSRVLRIPRSLFLRMLDGYPQAADQLRRILAQRVGLLEAELLRVRAAFAQPGARVARG